MWKLKKGLHYCGEDHLANGKEEAGKAKVTSWRNGRKAKYLKGMAFQHAGRAVQALLASPKYHRSR